MRFGQRHLILKILQTKNLEESYRDQTILLKEQSMIVKRVESSLSMITNGTFGVHKRMYGLIRIQPTPWICVLDGKLSLSKSDIIALTVVT